jgi:hypothetical protein
LPNQILIGYEPELLPSDTPPSNNETTEERIKNLKENHAIATRAINQMAKQNGTTAKQYSIRNLIWLEAKNLKFPHQATKLNPKRYGPFKITKEISPVAYQLQLPLSWNIHPTFHTSLLLPYSETPSHSPNFT